MTEKQHPLKGRKQTPEQIAARVAGRKRAAEARGGSYSTDAHKFSTSTPEFKERQRELMQQRWADGQFDNRPSRKGIPLSEETKAKMSEAKRQAWAEGRYDDKAPAARRAVSVMERSLAPYLAKLGYRHTEEQPCFIACEDRTRMPDFVDVEHRRVFEFFGNFWHHPDDEAVWIEQYHLKGWECTVLWEDELHDWLIEHADLVDEQTHTAALATSRARHRYPSRGNSLVFRD